MEILRLVSFQVATTGNVKFEYNFSNSDKATLDEDKSKIRISKGYLYEIEFDLDSYNISKKKTPRISFVWKNENDEIVDAPKVLDFRGKSSFYKIRNSVYKTLLIPTDDMCISLHVDSLINATINVMSCSIKVYKSI